MQDNEFNDFLYVKEKNNKFYYLNNDLARFVAVNGIEDDYLKNYLNMSVRLANALARNNIITFNDLIKRDLYYLIKLKNMGRKSFAELIALLEDFVFKDQVGKIPIVKSENTDDEKVIFNNFLLELKKLYENSYLYVSEDLLTGELSIRTTNVLNRNGIKNLESLSNKNWDYFIELSGFGKKSFKEFREYLYSKYPVKIQTNGDLKQIPNNRINFDFVQKISSDNENVKLSDLVNSVLNQELLMYDLVNIEDLKSLKSESEFYQNKEICNNYDFHKKLKESMVSYKDQIHDLFKEFCDALPTKHFNIILLRESGKTLEEIGFLHQVTRERIRQICQKIKRKFESSIISKKIFNYLSLIKGDDGYMTIEDLRYVLGKYTETFIFLTSENFDKELQIYFLSEKIKNEIHDEISNFPEMLLLSDFEKDLESFKYKNIVSNYIYKNFKIMNNFAFKSKPSLVKLFEIVLEEKFDHIKITDENEIDKFKDFYFEMFGDKSIYDKTSRAIVGNLQRIQSLSMIDRGVYFVKHISISEHLLSKLEDHIYKNKIISFKNLYDILKEELEKEHILNHYQLHGLIKKYCNNLYTNRDLVSIEPIKTDLDSEIKNFINKQKTSFSLKEIIKSIPILGEMNFTLFLNNNDDAINIYNKRFLPTRLLILSDNEKESIKQLIISILNNGEIITSQRILYEILSEHHPNVMRTNNIDNTHYANQFIKYFYKNDFQFINTCVFSLETKPYTQYEYIYNNFKDKISIKIKNIVDFCKNQFIVVQNTKTLLDDFFEKGYTRIDEETIFLNTKLSIPKEVINKIEEILISGMFKGEISTSDIEVYESFPKLSIKWNKHLLAHLIKNHGERLYVIDQGSQYTNLEYLFKEKDYE